MNFNKLVERIRRTHPRRYELPYAWQHVAPNILVLEAPNRVTSRNLRGRGIYGRLPGIDDPLYLLPGPWYTSVILMMPNSASPSFRIPLIFKSPK